MDRQIQFRHPWFKKVQEFLAYGLPVGITYLSTGVKITTTVLIRDFLNENGESFLVLANGSLIPLSDVISVYSHQAGSAPSTYRRFGGDDDFYKFQLPS